MASITYESDYGWILTTDDKEIKCDICSKALKTPFYACLKWKKYFCKACEISSKNVNYCRISKDEEHIHYNVKEVRQ